MRNFLKITICILVISASFYSCSENSKALTQTKKFEKISKIKNDSVFTNLFSNTFKTLQNVKNPKLAKKLSAKGKDLTRAEREKLAKVLGFKNKKAFIQNYKNYQKSIEYLNDKYNYSNYRQSKIKSLAMSSPGLQKSMPQMVTILFGANDCTSTCKRVAKDKAIAATAGAIVAHAGCAAADLFWIGVACHAAVIAGQAALSDEAYAEMKQCINSCKDDAE